MKQKTQYDNVANGFNIAIVNSVLLNNEVGYKLQNKYVGLHKVIDLKNKNNIKIKNNKGKVQIVHKNRLKLYKD